MKKEQLTGGKADKMSVADIAKKHGVSIESIEKEIELGMKIESEHTVSKEKQKEIAMDHIVEDVSYYSDKKTGLIAKEKEAEKNKEKLNEEAKKMMALAGIKEDGKKFLTNESFSEGQPLAKDNINPDAWQGMDSKPVGTFMEPNAMSQDKLDTVSKMMEDSKTIEETDSSFIVMEFDQIEVDPGEDDDKLYKLK